MFPAALGVIDALTVTPGVSMKPQWMQTQTSTMQSHIGLFSYGLAVFDSINVGGFSPDRLRL